MMSIGLALEPADEARTQSGLVGPNAVIQLGNALRALAPGTAERIYASAGFSRLLRNPPDAMIDEGIPMRLFEALWRDLPAGLAARVARDAGRRTGAYVLANRIPAPARLLLQALPARLSAPLLVKAIRKNAWTFAGSGLCRTEPGHPVVISILGNPLAMPGCAWHVGVFECLFRALVSPTAEVRHEAVMTDGIATSRFEIDW
jgi:divinyl protochlorophyllide a 8-vinyl-reductase